MSLVPQHLAARLDPEALRIFEQSDPTRVLSKTAQRDCQALLYPPTDTRPVTRLMAGDVLYHPNDPVEWLWLILDGSIEEWQGQLRLSHRGPQCLVGEVAVMVETPTHGSSAEAREDTTVLRIDAKAFRKAIARYPALITHKEFVERLVHHCAEYKNDDFSSAERQRQRFPEGRGVLPPPPYKTDESDIYMFLGKPSTPEAVAWYRGLLPPGVTWLSERFLLYGARFRGVQHGQLASMKSGMDYDEVAILIPTVVKTDTIIGKALPTTLGWFVIHPRSGGAHFKGLDIAGMPDVSVNNYIDDALKTDGGFRLLMRYQGVNALSVQCRPKDISGARDSAVFLGLVNAMTHMIKADWGLTDKDLNMSHLPVNLSTVSDLFSHYSGSVERIKNRVAGFYNAIDRLLPFDDALKALGGLTQHQQILGRFWSDLLSNIGLDGPGIRTDMLAWKREFAPSATYPHIVPQQVEWDPKDFQIDCIVRSPMVLRPRLPGLPKLIKVDRVDVDNDYFAPFALYPFNDEESWGLHIKAKGEMRSGSVLRDFLKHPPKEDSKAREHLRWGYPPKEDSPTTTS